MLGFAYEYATWFDLYRRSMVKALRSNASGIWVPECCCVKNWRLRAKVRWCGYAFRAKQLGKAMAGDEGGAMDRLGANTSSRNRCDIFYTK